jgi:hypothetical protein
MIQEKLHNVSEAKYQFDTVSELNEFIKKLSEQRPEWDEYDWTLDSCMSGKKVFTYVSIFCCDEDRNKHGLYKYDNRNGLVIKENFFITVVVKENTPVLAEEIPLDHLEENKPIHFYHEIIEIWEQPSTDLMKSKN